MKVVVLGGGRVGSAIARDLVGEFEVTVADVAQAPLDRLASDGIAGVRADLADPAALARVIGGADLVVGAVPGDMGFATVRTVIEAGKDIVDISFFPEDAFALDDLARARDVRAVVDCGIAPGADNMILGRLERELDEVRFFACYVGGLPVVRRWPWEYKAPFSPIDVLAEYTRPARLRRGGEPVTLPALSEAELLDFEGIGTLEAFNTDGLRSLLDTTTVPTMIEKTLRYPGYVDKMRLLRDAGFFSSEPVAVGGEQVRPLDVAAALLFPAWQLAEGEEDLTAMRVRIEGVDDRRRVRHDFDLLDRYDRASGTTSMARTTGYTCTAAVRALADGVYTRKGVSPPEYLGREQACYERVMAELTKRGVVFRHTVTELS